MTAVIKEENAAVRRWRAPVMERGLAEDPCGGEPPPEPPAAAEHRQQRDPPPVREIEQDVLAAREEGFKTGYDAGAEAGHHKGYEQGVREGVRLGRAEMQEQASQLEAEREELRKRSHHLQQLLAVLADPVSQLDKEIEDQLVALVIAVSRQLIRRELKTDPGQIVAVVRKAVSLLPVAAREYRLALHPEDAAMVREVLLKEDSKNSRPWTIVEDPTLTRGGCRVVSEASYIDATVERQLAAVAATLLGDEREGGE